MGWGQTNAVSAVCASCHWAIYNAYRATPMARSARKLDAASSAESSAGASFRHPSSGFAYRVSIRNGEYLLQFDNGRGGVRGEKPLAYAVGSGVRAFSYLIADDGFLYEAPVAYYAAAGNWGLAPGYERYNYPYLNRPIVPGCLSCHASSLQTEPLTLNRYRDPPFLEGGVACERCHGDGARHIAKMQAGEHTSDPAILNPAKLAAPQRDSICAQCHLTGAVRVMRAGADWRSFQPGDRLSDHMAVFVRAGKANGVTVTGHVENLAASACKRASGDRLWCGSCHDPHVVPAPTEAAVFYRYRCLGCHATQACTETPAARQKAKDDCVGCHMSKSPAADAQHTVFTDHSIPRRPRPAASIPLAPSEAELAPFGGGVASPRDLALAYAIAAIGKTTGTDRSRALSLLQRAATEYPNDSEVLISLAEIYRVDGKNDVAYPLYERALAIDPGHVTASVGLGGILMDRGEYADAIRLWNDALSKNSGLEGVRLNLAVALWKSGRRDAAEATLKRAISLNPAFTPARDLLLQISAADKR